MNNYMTSLLMWLLAVCMSMPVAMMAAEQEIIVRLATDSHLIPIYVGQVQRENTTISSLYAEQLHAILSFDCGHNGLTKIAPVKGKLAAFEERDLFSKEIHFAAVKESGVMYLIQLRIKGSELSCRVISANSQSIKQIDGMTITGVLDKDRVVIHRLSDTIVDLLFHTKGIATSKLIYTKRHQVKDSSGKMLWKSDLFECDYDGAQEKQLTHDGAHVVTPVYQAAHTAQESPGFCYVSYKLGQSKIFFVSKKDGKSKRLTPLRGNQMTPAISPQRHLVAFSCDAMGSADLFIQPFHPETGAIGKPRQIFTAKAGAQASPTFSPDGTRIAFVSGRDGIPKIYMMDIPKEHVPLQQIKPRFISKKCRENSAPSWSPDGKKIAYSARSSGPRQIWIYDVETEEERQLTDGPGDKENPSWAPDSLHLAFNLQDKKGSELYIVNLNQPQSVKISLGPGEKRFPVWK